MLNYYLRNCLNCIHPLWTLTFQLQGLTLFKTKNERVNSDLKCRIKALNVCNADKLSKYPTSF